jgi:adenylate kinase family enzyme
VERIAIIGCGGSGKTTLANLLGARLGLPVVHIDSHYWRVVGGERIESTPEQWAECHRRLVAEDRWIIEGMKLGVLDERLRRADTVVYLDVSTLACLSGILRRRLRHRGAMRPELGVYDRINWLFLRWVWSFRRRKRPEILARLEGFDGEVIVLRSRAKGRRLAGSRAVTPATATQFDLPRLSGGR